MAIHERKSGRLIGSCAFSQVDGENGSAMYHITIGEKDAWGRGYGTDLMQTFVRYLCESMPLDRIYLKTLDWNLRAQRCFENAGFQRYGRNSNIVMTSAIVAFALGVVLTYFGFAPPV